MKYEDIFSSIHKQFTFQIAFFSFQTQAEDLILQHSGEYISLLIGKKLDCPAKTRHVTEALCLCQYVERKLYNIKV